MSSEIIQRIVANRSKLVEEEHAFAVKYGFAYKRSQNFKNCVVIRWKTSKIKYEINHARIEEYVKICHDLSDKYGLWDKDDLFLDSNLRLIKAGILCIYEWSYNIWAIPNEFKEVRDFVLNIIPKWAKVTVKE